MNSKNNKTISKYLSKLLPKYTFLKEPAKNLEIVVVVPIYKEKDYIFKTIDSLLCCDETKKGVEVVLLFNASEKDNKNVIKEQKRVAETIRKKYCKRTNSWLSFVVEERYNIEKKHFGAGMARKLGMDIALARLFSVGKNEGLIVSLDADTLVLPNYFNAILEWFNDTAKKGASIYFEHPLDGNEFTPEVYDGITKYELHLRYFLQAWRITGFPYAYHTMGSAMAMRASAYAQIGGMPRKQAGEDFYFLQKLIPLGGFGDITKTKVIPSPRPSNRVIFGTGAAIKNMIKGSNDINYTYNYQAFNDLKVLFSLRSQLFGIKSVDFNLWCNNLAKPLQIFLLEYNFYSDLNNLNNNCSNIKIFEKRFWEIFNAFKVVKYLNFVHDTYFKKMSVLEAGLTFLNNNNHSTEGLNSEKKVLHYFRDMELAV